MPELTALYSPTVNSLQALRARRVGAAHGHVGRREPHLRDPRDRRRPELDARSSTGRRRRTSTRTSRWRRASPPGSTASSKKLEPPPAGKRRRVDERASFKALPRTLKEATAWLAASAGAREILGEPFVDHYVRTREWEVRQFERAVTEWELKRYFESI